MGTTDNTATTPQAPAATSGAAPQEGTGTNIPANSTPATPQEGNATATNSGQPTMTLEELQAAFQQLKADHDRKDSELKSVRREAATYRTKLKEHDDAQLSELERAQQQAKEATDALNATRARVARYEIEKAAGKLGIIDPDVAATLIASALELDEHGIPTNAESLLRQLVKDKSYLANSAAVGGSATNSARTNTPQGYFTRAQIADLDFYGKHQAEIDTAIREGRITG